MQTMKHKEIPTPRGPEERSDPGFGAVVSTASGRRLLNTDGTFNVRRTGLPWSEAVSLFHAALVGVRALMIRMANRRKNELIELNATLSYSFVETVDGESMRRYRALPLDRSKVTFLPLSWTTHSRRPCMLARRTRPTRWSGMPSSPTSSTRRATMGCFRWTSRGSTRSSPRADLPVVRGSRAAVARNVSVPRFVSLQSRNQRIFQRRHP